MKTLSTILLETLDETLANTANGGGQGGNKQGPSSPHDARTKIAAAANTLGHLDMRHSRSAAFPTQTRQSQLALSRRLLVDYILLMRCLQSSSAGVKVFQGSLACDRASFFILSLA